MTGMDGTLQPRRLCKRSASKCCSISFYYSIVNIQYHDLFLGGEEGERRMKGIIYIHYQISLIRTNYNK